MSLADRLMKNSKIKGSAMIKESKVFGKKDMIQTSVPMINVALSGRLDGGLSPGLLVLAGPSKHFKSAFALIMAAAFQRKYPEGIVLFYDSEFGSPEAYFESFGIDMDRVLHNPIKDIEELKYDLMSQVTQLEDGDKVFILVDSIGNLASKKEVDDAIDEKSVADMTRAKQLKSLFRMVTPYLNLKDLSMVAINHTYKTMEMYSKDVVSGGTGIYYSADAVWIVGRQQEKDGKEITGYDFIINIDKSRHVREKSKIPISVSFKGGIDKWSGLFELAKDMGYIRQKGAWYDLMDPTTGEVLSDKNLRKAEIENDPTFWNGLMANADFRQSVKDMYTLSSKALNMDEDKIEDIVEEEEIEDES